MINNVISERKIKQSIPFTIPTKSIEYLGINKFTKGDKRTVLRKL